SCKPVSTPLVLNEKLSKDDGTDMADSSVYRSLIGNLLYLTATRPDLIYSASLLSGFMQSPSKIHFGTVKRVLRYVRRTTHLGIWFRSNAKEDLTGLIELKGYLDSDWGGSVDDMKRISRYCFCFNSGVFSWNHSIKEAEKNGDVSPLHCKSKDQLAGIFTKCLPKNKFEGLRSKLGVSSIKLKEEC
ncbi:hypothetical protein CFOL_v3_21485, partial [Cephalotus follicularis]